MKSLKTWPKRKFLSLSVSKKIILATALASIATLSLFTVVSSIREWQSYANRKIDQLASISRIIASNSQAALTFEDPYTAEEYMASLSQEKDITSAVLFNQDGAAFATFRREGLVEDELSFPDFIGPNTVGRRILYATPVEFNGNVIGTLLIVADMNSIRASQIRSLQISLGLFLSGLALASLIAYRIQKYVTKPLAELTDLARSVSHDKDYSRRAEKRYDDEIGLLVEGFNFMMENVHERDEEIKDHNKNLESEVAERTVELKSAMIEAQQASQAKSDFLSTMSHELRTPMNAIVGITSLIMGSEMDDEMRSHLDIIRNSSDNLLSLINDVLDYSKIESGKLELESEEFNLPHCLEDAMDLVAAQKRDTKRVFVTSIDPTLPSIIIGDVTRLRQVVINLLGNAAKFTEKGYVWLEAKRISENTMRIAIHDTGIGIPKERMDRLFKSFSQVDSSTTRQFGGTGLGLAISQKLTMAMGGEISVSSESGVGSVFQFDLVLKTGELNQVLNDEQAINCHIVQSGFEDPMKHSLEEKLSVFGGRSKPNVSTKKILLQSAISDTLKKAVEKAKAAKALAKSGESVILVSHLEHAAALNTLAVDDVLTLPVKTRSLHRAIYTQVHGKDEIKKSSKAIEKSDTNDPKSNLRILLAEDNVVNQRVFKLIMKREGCTIDVANNGKEALDRVTQNEYDIVFMDLQMPVMGGIESCEQIRSIGKRIHQPWIIGFTANVEADAVPAMRLVGMNDYLAKPVKNTDVRKKLESYLQEPKSDIGMN